VERGKKGFAQGKGGRMNSKIIMSKENKVYFLSTAFGHCVRKRPHVLTCRNKKQIAAIVIPTYNEAGNIGALLEEIQGVAVSASNWQIIIVVVDGNSSDGTINIVESMVAKQPGFVHLVKESGPSGIGSAYCLGFKYAIDKIKADVVIEFDGDFQHPTSCILGLLEEIKNGYDYVVASRSIEEGGETVERGMFRSLLTKFGGFLARVILFFPGQNFREVTDPTTGLKATRVKGFADRLRLNPTSLKSRRFGYKIQWLYETIQFGARYKEIPLKFENRRAGVSKFSWSVIIDILRVCIAVRTADPHIRRFMRYAVVGCGGYIINAVLLEAVFRLTGVEFLAWVISAEVAIISNFFFNNVWTFNHRRKIGFYVWLSGLAQFNLASLGAIVIEGVFGPLITMIVGNGYRQLALVFVVLFIVTPYNWFMYNRFIWK
jgi:dolichol-phosphate mannosyltransferase